jgi:uncharacterized protein (DUF952 family)
MADHLVLYRLAPAAEVPDDAWRTRLQWTAAFVGTAGLDDDFVHLSTAEQVVGTADAYFSGRQDVTLLCYSVQTMREEADLDVRWEAAAPPPGASARAGEFPHVYGGAIPYACLASPPALLTLGPDGKHAFPQLGPSVAAAAAVLGAKAEEEEEEDMYHDSDGSYDGCAATGMYG